MHETSTKIEKYKFADDDIVHSAENKNLQKQPKGLLATSIWHEKNWQKQEECRELASKFPEKVISYLAGFFDGEGCISVMIRKTRKSGSYVQIKVGGCVIEPMSLFKEVFGGEVFTAKRKTASGKDVHYYRATVNQTRVILEVLLPYLLVKRDQAKKALELFAVGDTMSHIELSRNKDRIRLFKEVKNFNAKRVVKK